MASKVPIPDENFPKDWEKQIINLYKEGASDVEIKALIYEWRGSFSNDLWSRLMSENGVFSETIKIGKMYSQIWWQKQGKDGLWKKGDGIDLNPTLWFMNMKNRFPDDWRDKQDISHDGHVQIVPKFRDGN